MIHTGKFYIILEKEELGYISRKFKEKITMVTKIFDKEFDGIKTTITNRFYKWWMFIDIDFIKLIGGSKIQENDIIKIQLKIQKYLDFIFGKNNKELTLLRLDFRFDAIVTDIKQRELLLKLYKKSIEKHRFKRKNDHYTTTIYYNSKSLKVIVYDKETERKAKNEPIQEYEKNVLRLEVCLLNKHLNYMKRAYGLEKRIETYMTADFWNKYMDKNVSPIFYSGDYYPINISTKIIEKSSLKQIDKDRLRSFLCDVSCYGMDGIINLKQERKGNLKLKYSKYLIDRYISILNNLGINPISIPKHDYPIIKDKKYLGNPFKLYS